MKIDIEELMVGDWVMIHEYPMIKEPRKVVKEHFVRSLCEFEAIPLTNEFWLNNGFEFLPTEKTESKGVFYLKTQRCFLAYTNTNNVMQIYKARIDEIDPKTRNCIRVCDSYDIKCDTFRIDYVHELQHILRLCKIEYDFIL
jgi:hypothetical protein